MEHLPELDERIESSLENWDLQRVSLIDKNILRFALAEILYFDEIPSKVIINEAIEIAQKISQQGVSGIEATGGTYSDNSEIISATGINRCEDEACFSSYAGELIKQIDISVFLVGGNRSFENMSLRSLRCYREVSPNEMAGNI